MNSTKQKYLYEYKEFSELKENYTKGVNMKQAFNEGKTLSKSELAEKRLECVNVKSVSTQYGQQNVYDVRLPDKTIVSFFGSPVIDTQEIKAGDVFTLKKVKNKANTREYWIAEPLLSHF